MDIPRHNMRAPLRNSLLAAAALTISIASGLASTVAIGADQLFQHRDADGVVTFSDAPMVNGQVTRQSYTSFQRQPVIANPCRGLSSAQLDAKGRKLDHHFISAAQQHSIDPALIKAVARAESCFDPAAVSRAGAKGLMQLMPATATAMGVEDIFNQRQNLAGGAKYLAAMLARYSSDTEMALAAYNAGPGNVDKYKGVPPFQETQRYIVSVNKFRQRYAAAMPQTQKVASNP